MSAKKPDKKPDNLDTGDRKPLEDLGQIKDELATGDTPTKKRGKRGPYRKKAKQPEPEVVENPIDAKVLENVYQLLFSTLAGKNGQPHWNLSPDESKALADATGAVLDKYAPMVAGYLPELNLAVTVVGIIGMKFYASMQIAEATKAVEAEKEKPKDGV